VEYHLDQDIPPTSLPWVKAIHPAPIIVGTALVLEGDVVALRCRAMGFPKPYLSWVNIRSF